MSKALDVLMAGLISGLVAITTSQLGLAGTVIGAVLGSMLYQLMSSIFRQPLDELKTQKVEREIFYIFPLILILGIEIIYLLATVYLTPEQIIFFLQDATGGNLFRTVGIGLLVMGIYPILQPQNIPRKYGIIVLAVAIIKLLIGFSDVELDIVNLYAPLIFQFKEIISLIVIGALSYVIISIARDSITIIREKETLEKNNNQDPKT